MIFPLLLVSRCFLPKLVCTSEVREECPENKLPTLGTCLLVVEDGTEVNDMTWRMKNTSRRVAMSRSVEVINDYFRKLSQLLKQTD